MGQETIFTLLSYMSSLIYFQHFMFRYGLVRMFYFVFVILYPIVTFMVCVIIGLNLKNKVLKDQHKSAENAEFLDWEDTEADILRKAKTRTVNRKVMIQMFAMTPLALSGFLKMSSQKDFPMQIYSCYLVELVFLSIPILLLQIINNALIKSWNFTTIAFILCLCINMWQVL